MAVVINEFEVVPAVSRAASSEPAAREERPRDAQRELDTALRRRATRARRTRAV